MKGTQKSILFRGGRAFTLLEVVVAMAILFGLCVLLSRIATGVQGMAGPNLRRFDADGQAQLIFDRMAADLGGLLPRADVPISIDTTGGSPFLTFFSQVPTEAGGRNLSLLSYRLENDRKSGEPVPRNRLSFQRASKGLDWTDAGFMGVKADGSTVDMAHGTATPKPEDEDYDVLASGVIRMALACQLRDGSVPASAPLTGGNADISKIGAIIVTLVVLDESSLNLLTPDQVETVAEKFPTPEADNLALSGWEAIARDKSHFAGLPSQAVSSIQVYQRFFPLHVD